MPHLDAKKVTIGCLPLTDGSISGYQCMKLINIIEIQKKVKKQGQGFRGNGWKIKRTMTNIDSIDQLEGAVSDKFIHRSYRRKGKFRLMPQTTQSFISTQNPQISPVITYVMTRYLLNKKYSIASTTHLNP